MPKYIRLKNTSSEVKLFNQRAIILSIAITVLVMVLIARLAFLQIYEHDRYTTLSNQNQLNLIPIDPTRGLIYDRNGILLAENLPAFSLDIIPDKVKNIQQTINELKKLIPITDTNLKDFHKFLLQKRRFEPVPLKLNLTETEVARFTINQWRFPGVLVNARLLRYYPYGQAYAHILGYMGRINQQELDDVDQANYSATDYIGKIGIEKFYETDLHGTVGYQQAETDASGRTVRNIKRTPPVAGNALYLTIDSALQKAAEEAFGDQPGALVAIDPSNGEILAMVSNPSYDPNLFVAGITDAVYKALQNAPNRPLYNRAIRGLFPPASTVKPYIALQALGAGVSPTYTVTDNGYFYYGDHVYKDWNWKKGGHGRVSIQRAISVSCDYFFYTMALKLGIKGLDDIFTAFGYGRPTGVDVGEELPGLVPTPAWKKRVKKQSWYPGDTIVAGIGQGYTLVTPIQLASAVSAMSQRGIHYTPHFMLKMVKPDGTIILPPHTRLPDIKFPKEDWDIVIAGMRGIFTVAGGTGYHYGRDTLYTIAAKTGTAQVYNSRKKSDDNQAALPFNLRDNSMFVAFAPMDKPLIAVAVIGEHSTNASAYARKVIDYYLLTERHWSGAPKVPIVTEVNAQNNPTNPTNGAAAAPTQGATSATTTTTPSAPGTPPAAAAPGAASANTPAATSATTAPPATGNTTTNSDNKPAPPPPPDNDIGD